MLRRNDLLLLRIAQADAYAADFEFAKRAHIEEHHKLLRYVKHPIHRDTGGLYTDDTQMSIAVAEALLLNKDLTPKDFANAFVCAFKRDERDGYARGFQAFLESIKSGDEFMAKIKPKSDKNGAAMRSVPIGILPDPREVLRIAEMQAKLTHDTEIGIFSSQAVALMAHFAFYFGDEENDGFARLHEFCRVYLPKFDFRKPWQGEVRYPATNTVHAVFDLLTRSRNLMDILDRAVLFGGDTDSVAAIAWGIAGTRMRDQIVPDFLETDLEIGRNYGPKFLRELGRKLMNHYKAPHPKAIL